jgi:hypothetical protein
MVLGFCSVVVTNSEELYKLKNSPLWSILEAPFKHKRRTVWNNLFGGDDTLRTLQVSEWYVMENWEAPYKKYRRRRTERLEEDSGAYLFVFCLFLLNHIVNHYVIWSPRSLRAFQQIYKYFTCTVNFIVWF